MFTSFLNLCSHFICIPDKLILTFVKYYQTIRKPLHRLLLKLYFRCHHRSALHRRETIQSVDEATRARPSHDPSSNSASFMLPADNIQRESPLPPKPLCPEIKPRGQRMEPHTMHRIRDLCL